MARFDSFTVDVGTSPNVKISSTPSFRVRSTNKITSIEISPRDSNEGDAMYLGTENVSPTNGRKILRGESYWLSLGAGGDALDNFYLAGDAENDVADCVVLW